MIYQSLREDLEAALVFLAPLLTALAACLDVTPHEREREREREICFFVCLFA